VKQSQTNQPALAEQDPSLEIIDDSLEISEQMPPLPE